MAKGNRESPIEGNFVRQGIEKKLTKRQESEKVRALIRGWSREDQCLLGTLICRRVRDPVTEVVEIKRGASCIYEAEGELYIDTGVYGVEGEHKVYDKYGRLRVILREVRN